MKMGLRPADGSGRHWGRRTRGGRRFVGGIRPRTRDRSAPRSGTTEGRDRLRPVSTWASLCLPSRGAVSATVGEEAGMEAIVERAAGPDVHQGSVVACVIIGAVGRRPTKGVRSFGTMRRDLAALRAWLLEEGVTHVDMEGTGVHRQPVHAALEGAFAPIVGNAHHIRAVPGRETDVKDAEWIAEP